MTLVEILLPLLFTGVLIVLRQKVPVKDYPDAKVYQSFSVSSLPNQMPHRFQLAFVPSNSSVVRQVAEDVRGKLELSAGRFTPHIPHPYEHTFRYSGVSRLFNRHISLCPRVKMHEVTVLSRTSC